jgi:hypothetical protein
MFRSIVIGIALSLIGSAAMAAAPLHVTTAFSSGISNSDPFKANLESIGVALDLAPPFDVQVFSPATLNFRLLESRAGRSSEVDTLHVGGTTYDVTPQAFAPVGTLLGSQLFSGSFSGTTGFRLTDFEDDQPPVFWPDAFRLYIRSSDADNLTGIGPFIGNFDTLYFSVNDMALFEVSAAYVPEPATWALIILGFGATGAALRVRRRGSVIPV